MIEMKAQEIAAVSGGNTCATGVIGGAVAGSAGGFYGVVAGAVGGSIAGGCYTATGPAPVGMSEIVAA
jgi:hypothetical protein